MSTQPLPFAPASERNRRPILDALSPRMPATGRLLEVGAGTGQHAVFLAQAFPGLSWLATDCRSELPGLQARLDAEGGTNLLPARPLDVLRDEWPRGPFEAAFTANTAHIMPWSAVQAALAGFGAVLATGAPLFIYGPFRIDGTFTTESNRQFDQELRQRAPHMGLRDLEAVESEASRHQLELQERLDMPANNFMLVFRKTEAQSA